MTDTPKPRSHGMIQPRVSAQPRPLIGPDKGRPDAFRAKVLTLFPECFPGTLSAGLTGKALKDRLWALEAIDIRRFATDKHRTVDDSPAGGGAGMVMRADIIAKALDFAAKDSVRDRLLWPVLYLSPRGKVLTQQRVQEIAAGQGVTLLCGRYEGVDERVLDARGVEEISIGDYVLTGGEPAAQVLLDAVIRLRPGVLGNAESTEHESHAGGLLEHPHYTKPPVWEGREIPEVLLSGHHARIAEWRADQAEQLTQERRPDLWAAHKDRHDAAPLAEQAPKLSDAEMTAEKARNHKD
ncbi:MAG: tRNA (guanosine(37)-N1)-methyltransferase TrmD [Pseudomonadota bacterium]